MGTPTATFTNGSIMVAADVMAALDLARAYLDNGIVAADLPDNGLGSENVFRPTYGLVPQAWEEAESQSLAGNISGIETITWPDGDIDDGRGVGMLTSRVDIYPFKMAQGDAVAVRGLGRRLPVQGPVDVEITASFFAIPVDPGGTDDHAGHFNLRYRRVQDDLNGEGTIIDATKRQLWGSAEQRGYFNIAAQVSLTDDGDYDFFVTYSRGACATTIQQVIVAQRSLVVEVFQQ